MKIKLDICVSKTIIRVKENKMIKTKDLEEFIGAWLVVRNPSQREYKAEIVVRLKGYDKLMEVPRNRAIVKRLSG
jgi:hypothetical protein